MSYLSLALAIIRVIISVLDIAKREQWINEGARRVTAKQIKEINDALVRAAGVSQEWNDLEEEQVRQRFEEKGWFSE